jgi:hypothetical protein
MSFEGKVRNGVIVLENGQQLADGTRVDVTVRAAPTEPARSQADLLDELRRRSYTPPAGTPESEELLRQDRNR